MQYRRYGQRDAFTNYRLQPAPAGGFRVVVVDAPYGPDERQAVAAVCRRAAIRLAAAHLVVEDERLDPFGGQQCDLTHRRVVAFAHAGIVQQVAGRARRVAKLETRAVQRRRDCEAGIGDVDGHRIVRAVLLRTAILAGYMTQ